MKPNRICGVCGSKFYAKSQRKYCSDACRKKSKETDFRYCTRINCKYLGTLENKVCCDYIIKTGAMRDCAVKDCKHWKDKKVKVLVPDSSKVVFGGNI